MLTCRVVAKWRRLPVIVAGWLALEREKAMQVTHISNPLAELPTGMPVLQVHPIFCEVLWNILMGNPWFSETVSLCTVNSQQHIQVQCFVTASETVLTQLLALLHPSLLLIRHRMLPGNNQGRQSTWRFFYRKHLGKHSTLPTTLRYPTFY